jgi:two-component system LytT family sensor kinase
MSIPESSKTNWFSKRIGLHVLFWIVVYVFNVLEGWYRSEDKAAIAEMYAAQLPLQMAAAYLLSYVQIPRYLFPKKYIKFIGSLLVSVYFICSIYVTYKAFYFESAHPGYFKPEPAVSIWMYFDFFKYLMYAVMFYEPAIVMAGIKLVRTRAEEERKVQSLEKEKLQAELSFLKNQLNPHFLFNTLNNLYMLTLKFSPQAPEVVAKLSETLDYMLYRCHERLVPLKGEILLIQNYILLEKLRLSKNISINFTFREEELESKTIAPLIMLSLVENAFKHGITNGNENSKVDIKLQVREQTLQFTVRNTKGKAISSKSKGIGLKNIQRQLELIYPKKYKLSIDNTEETYSTELQITHA